MSKPSATRAGSPQRIAIVGAGVAGCAAALALSRQGLAVDLFEAVAEPQPIGAGLLLQPTGQQVLQALGLLEPLLGLGAKVDRLFGDTPSGRTVLDMSYHRFSPQAYGLGVQRGALMGVLWQALRASEVNWRCGVAASRFEQEGEQVRLFAGETALGSYAALLLANGSFSKLREQMQVKQSARVFPYGALWTVLPRPAQFPELDLRQRFRGARQMLGLMPVGRNFGDAPEAAAGVNLFWSLPLAEVQGWHAAAGAQGLARLKQEMVDLLPLCEPLLGGLQDPAQLRQARYADVQMAHWHQGRVLAIGDCGHGMSPQLGQGANLALIDAHVLAGLCAGQNQGQLDWPALLARYSRERRAHLRFYSQASRGLTPMFQSNQRLAPFLRDRFFGWGGRLPLVHQQSIATLSGVKTGWLLGRLKL
ncbi:NAD(P)/FAD-dependent oxidoreductase [Paucibacter sp. KBW04]|uniref:FAD-dependent oxidoreductase n=1 Tax=Paucibacter sp. KBW04 TaxID=2153361 RepID=UPI0018CC0C07|nr:NAD(P)/FAD-dependent oxidoreductase [Paucibacter sp. KBW04]